MIPQINNLTAQDVVTDNDLFPVWSGTNSDTRRVTGAGIKAFVQSSLPGAIASVYAAPSASGFTVTMAGQSDQWLILTPSAGYAAGAIVLPPAPADRQLVTVSCSQAITTLTVSAADTVRGAPTTLAANGFFSMRFDDVTNVWVRVG
jgi:hypothetical protein